MRKALALLLGLAVMTLIVRMAAFAAEPDVILCDEVTSALDVSVQASVLRLLRELSSKRHVACILVSHDLAVVQALSHRIAVLYRGRLVELGPSQDVCGAPLHPYTQALIAAVLEPDTEHHIDRSALARDSDDSFHTVALWALHKRLDMRVKCRAECG
jgi:ABC-type dipeptide/oligopeptide/nickel transport system ATPase component